MNSEKKLLLKIADIGFSINWQYPPLLRHASFPYYKGFIYNGASKGIVKQLKEVSQINVHYAKSAYKISPSRDAEKFMSIPRFWSLYRDQARFIMEIFYPPQNLLVSIAEISIDFSRADYYILRFKNEGKRVRDIITKKYWLLPQLTQPLIKSLLVNILAKHGGCLLHGTGVKISNHGLAFIGESGSGKSTLAGLFCSQYGATVLTDENLVITKRENKFYIQGTPWPGGARLANASAALVKKIFFISHGKDNIIRPLSPKEAFNKIIAQSVVSLWDKSLVNRLLIFLKELSEKIIFFDLEFVKDKRIIPFVKKLIA